jgi:ribosomal protein S18 acetylase RimI-like enzyme
VPKYHFEIISSHHHELPSIIEASIGKASKQKIETVLDSYHLDKRILIGCFLNERLVGVIGIESHRDTLKILHLSVRANLRNQGIGRELIIEAAKQLRPTLIYAETDGDSIGFYQKLGFICAAFNRPFGSRFACKKSYPASIYTIGS